MRKPGGVLRVVALVLAATLVMAGCSKNSGTAPDVYAKGVCGAINTWLESVQNGANNIGSVTSPAEGKTAVVKYLSDVTASTQTMINKVDAVGAPATDNGEEVQATLLSALNKVKDVFSEAEKKAETLSTTDQAAFTATMTEIGTSLQAASGDVDSSLSSVSSAGLDDAFKADAECQKLQQATSSTPSP